MNQIVKTILAILLVLVMINVVIPEHLVLAEEEGETTEDSGNEAESNESEKKEAEPGPVDPMYGASYGKYKGEGIYYYLDIVNPKDLEEEGWFSKAWDYISLNAVDEKITETLHYSIFFVVEMTFQLNIFLTNVMLSILNFAYSTNVIDALVDNTERTISNLTGVSGGRFDGNGLFGGFLGVIGVLVGLYTLYQYIVKKASITAFSGILKSTFALTLALFFFSNYAAMIKGAHALSTDISAALLSGEAGMDIDQETGVIENKTVRDKMNDNIFTMFVHRPYLMLQYGTTIEEDIGQERVEQLLKTNKGDERKDIVITEVTEKSNDTLVYPNVLNRLVFSWVMTITNAISSIPIYLLAFSLVAFQFWFLVIALIAPFVFVWSAMPNQFGVLKRYFFELSIPLALKMVVSVIALVIFGLTDILYNINTLGGGTQGYIITTLIQSLILFVLFLLRKRIFNVFSIGSRELSIMREQMSSTYIDPMKKQVRAASAIAGATAGTILGGPQGGMIGANIGSSIGGVATGEADIQQMTRDAAISMMAMERMKRNNNKSETSPVNLESGSAGYSTKIASADYDQHHEDVHSNENQNHVVDQGESDHSAHLRNNAPDFRAVSTDDNSDEPLSQDLVNTSVSSPILETPSDHIDPIQNGSNDRATPLQGTKIEGSILEEASKQAPSVKANQRQFSDKGNISHPPTVHDDLNKGKPVLDPNYNKEFIVEADTLEANLEEESETGTEGDR